jgi:hypothetical protein
VFDIVTVVLIVCLCRRLTECIVTGSCGSMQAFR